MKQIIYIIVFLVYVTSVLGLSTSGDVVDSGFECDTGRGYKSNNGSFVCASLSQVNTQQTLSVGITSNITGSDITKRQIFEDSVGLQDISGSTSIQVGTNLEGKEIKLAMLKERTELIKAYITSLIKLVVEFMKIVFYLVELRLLLYIFLGLIPSGFFKLRDMLVQSFLRRV